MDPSLFIFSSTDPKIKLIIQKEKGENNENQFNEIMNVLNISPDDGKFIDILAAIEELKRSVEEKMNREGSIRMIICKRSFYPVDHLQEVFLSC